MALNNIKSHCFFHLHPEQVNYKIFSLENHSKNGISGDLLVMNIRQTLHYPGQITGEINAEDLFGN